MARKTYSEHEREQVREALLTTALLCIVDRGLIHSSIEVPVSYTHLTLPTNREV